MSTRIVDTFTDVVSDGERKMKTTITTATIVIRSQKTLGLSHFLLVVMRLLSTTGSTRNPNLVHKPPFLLPMHVLFGTYLCPLALLGR